MGNILSPASTDTRGLDVGDTTSVAIAFAAFAVGGLSFLAGAILAIANVA